MSQEEDDDTEVQDQDSGFWTWIQNTIFYILHGKVLSSINVTGSNSRDMFCITTINDGEVLFKFQVSAIFYTFTVLKPGKPLNGLYHVHYAGTILLDYAGQFLSKVCKSSLPDKTQRQIHGE